MGQHTTKDRKTGAADASSPPRVLLTPQETAERVKCSTHSLRRWARNPDLNPAFPAPVLVGPERVPSQEGGVTGGQMRRWVESEIDEYIAGLARYVPPPAAEKAGR